MFDAPGGVKTRLNEQRSWFLVGVTQLLTPVHPPGESERMGVFPLTWGPEGIAQAGMPADKAGAPVSEARSVHRLHVPSPERRGQVVLGLRTAVPMACEEAVLAASSHCSFETF